jgi:hypothetical protein
MKAATVFTFCYQLKIDARLKTEGFIFEGVFTGDFDNTL